MLEGKKYQRVRRATKLTKEVLAKIKAKVVNRDFGSIQKLSQELNLAPSTLRTGITRRLNLKKKKKKEVHYLEPKDMANRKRNARKLYEEILSGEKSQFVVSLDESKIYHSQGSTGSDYYYVEQGKEEERKLNPINESFPQNFMIIGAMSENQTYPLMKVPAKVKVNARYYIDRVLKPLVHKYLIPHFKHNINRVVIHHDKATSHTSVLTRNYLQELNEKYGIRFIEKEDIPVKGCDISPLDFFGFGFIKQQLKMTRARTLAGVWKKCRTIWSQVSPETCKNVFDAWKRRCRAVYRNDGRQVEHLKQIHRRKIHK